MKHKVNYGTTEIEYSLERRDRKTLSIQVHPDQSVQVIAPIQSETDLIAGIVKKKGKWIVAKKNEYSRMQPVVKYDFISGESLQYLDKQYKLKVIHTDREEVKLVNGQFHLSIPENADYQTKRNLIINWYAEQAQEVFKDRLMECIKATNKIGIAQVPNWQVKYMAKRWGSCTGKKKILLNPELLIAPKACIDYVIFHELCHLKEHNHSKRFYGLLDQVYPGWKQWKKYLDYNIQARVL